MASISQIKANRERGNLDLGTSEGLLELAQFQKGLVQQRAEEITGQRSTFLGKVGRGFLTGLNKTIDVLQTPSEILAGVISPEVSIKEAMERDLTVGEVVLGTKKAKTKAGRVAKGLSKFAIDVVTDPLQWVTAGFGVGTMFGKRATTVFGKLSKEGAEELLEQAARRRVGGKLLTGKFGLKKAGQTLLKTREAQMAQGFKKTVDSFLKQTKTRLAKKLGEEGAEKFIKLNRNKILRDAGLIEDFSKELSQDFTKKALEKMLRTNPARYQNFIDRGGIKVFNKTLLSAERIGTSVKTIPLFTKLDELTTPIRNTLGSLFDTSIDKEFGKLPSEFTDLATKYSDLGNIRQSDAVKSLVDIAKVNNLNNNEVSMITDLIERGIDPVDPKLKNVVQQINRKLGRVRKEEIKRGLLIDKPRVLRSQLAEITKLEKIASSDLSSTIVEQEVNKGLSKLFKDRSTFLEKSMKSIDDIPSVGKNTSLDLQKKGIKTLDDLLDIKKTGKFIGDEFDPFANIRGIFGKNTDNIVRAAEETLESNKGLKNLIPGEIKFTDKNDAIKKLAQLKRVLGTEKKMTTSELLRTEKIFENYVPHVLVDEKPNIKVPFKPQGSKAGIAFAKKRKLTGTIKEIEQEVGKEVFEKNILKSSAKRMVASARGTTAFDFYEDAVKKFGSLADEAQEGFVDAGIKELEKYKFNPAIAKGLNDFQKAFTKDESISAVMKAFDNVQNLFKVSVTSMFPAFHGRNAISNVFLNYLDIGSASINPAKHAVAGELLFLNNQADNLARKAYGTGKAAAGATDDLTKLMSKKVLKDRFGTDYTFGELQKLIKENRVAFGDEFLGFMDIGETIGKQVDELGKLGKTKDIAKKALPISQKFKGFEVGKKVGNVIEEQARLVNFVSNLQKTGDPILAAKRTKQFLFDYANLTNFEKTFMRRVVPFYTFTRKNLALQAKTLVTAPGRIATEVRAAKTIGDVISGGQKLSEEDRQKLPEWIRDSLGIFAGKKGGVVDIVGGFQTPFEQPFQAFQPNQLLGSVSPLIRSPIEQLSGYNFFYGKPISEVTNAAAFQKAPKVLQDLIGMKKITYKDQSGKQKEYLVSLRPEMMHFITNLPPTSRVFSVLRQINNPDLSKSKKALQQLTGTRIFSFDIEKEAKTREKELRRKLEDLLDKANVVHKFERVFIPKEK